NKTKCITAFPAPERLSRPPPSSNFAVSFTFHLAFPSLPVYIATDFCTDGYATTSSTTLLDI
ncbi:MAG TPA: hypothetical protein VFF42_06285, partial [Candidatus Eremiobacteraceae bacterium]|nr:hypothetical protein [Candidatus Eremiobacteraceae bacterium]